MSEDRLAAADNEAIPAEIASGLGETLIEIEYVEIEIVEVELVIF